MAARGRHREVDEGRNWGIIFIWVLCSVMLIVAVSLLTGIGVLFTADVTPDPLPRAHQEHAAPTVAATPTAGLAQRAATVEEVLANTQFVQRYKKDQPGVARGHTDRDLASHGIASCAYIADARITVTEMVYTYMNDWHNHAGYRDGPQQANHTFSLALQEVCPNLLPKWKAKRAL